MIRYLLLIAIAIQSNAAYTSTISNLSFFHDPTGNLSAEQVVQKSFDKKDLGGFYPGKVWAKAQICGRTGNHFLVYKDPIETLRVFLELENGLTSEAGHNFSEAKETLQHYWATVPLPQTGGGCKSTYIMFESGDVMNFSVQLMSMDQLLNAESQYQVFYSIFFSFSLLVLALSLIFFARTKEWTYFFFAGLILTQDLGGVALLSGFMTKHVMSPATFISYDVGNFFALMMNIFQILFALAFIDVRQKWAAWISRGFVALQTIMFGQLVLGSLFETYHRHYLFSQIVNNSILFACFWILILALLNLGQKNSRYFLLASSAKVAGQIVKTLLLQGTIKEDVSFLGADLSPVLYNIIPLGSLVETIVIISFLVFGYFRSLDDKNQQILDMLDKVKKSERDSAIAATVSMVAHDIRKPLSIAKGAMTVLRGAKTPQEFMERLKSMEGEIDQARKSADSMLEDILEFSSEMRLSQEPTSIIFILERSLKETANYFPKPASVDLEVEWNHKHLLICDSERLLRTFSNILVNACQAMRLKGRIWVRTKEQYGDIEIALGNSKSSIPEEIRKRIFDFSITAGKRKGSGLGLAVAKKTIEAHGGTIGVTSDHDSKTVEFQITLKASANRDDFPRKTQSRLADYLLKADNNPQRVVSQKRQIERIREFTRSRNASIVIAVLDDEKIFRQTIQSIVNESPINDILDLREFATPQSLLSADLENIDFLISDVDLGTNIDGYDVVRSIRQEKGLIKLPICISSNKALNADYKKAIDAGATTFLPKPMTIDHLLKFLNDCLVSSREFRH